MRDFAPGWTVAADAGDKVWGYDFAAGRWTLAEVAARHDRDYRGDLYTLVAETGETVRTTT
ncbi:MAG: hypothetical protein ACRC1K_25730, partial [Planctomycetia bacterium]